MNRRKFFKQAVVKGLPILAFSMVTSLTTVAHAATGCKDCSRSCTGNCWRECQNSCTNGCSGSCKSSCVGSSAACTI